MVQPVANLNQNLSLKIRRAAELIFRADALLITTGAGMGVDSGLATYRGRNAGV